MHAPTAGKFRTFEDLEVYHARHLRRRKAGESLLLQEGFADYHNEDADPFDEPPL